MDAIRIGWWWWFHFHARAPNILIMTDLFFATYGELELVLLTKAWKMHGSLSYVVVNRLIELAIASNSTRHTGGKLVIGCHPDTCPISKSGT